MKLETDCVDLDQDDHSWSLIYSLPRLHILYAQPGGKGRLGTATDMGSFKWKQEQVVKPPLVLGKT